jgi:hypothetical protein
MSRIPLDLVWLRLGRGVPAEPPRRPVPHPLTLRLSIAPSIAIQLTSRSRAIADRAITTRKPDAPTMVMVESLALRRAATARILREGHADSWTRARAVSFTGSSRSIGRAMAPRMMSSSPRILVSGSHVPALRRGPFDGPVTLARSRTRMPADVRRFASVPMTSRRTRMEPHVLAPPPMVGRTTSSSTGGQPRQSAHDIQSPLAFRTDERNAWMQTPSALAAALSPGVLDSVTDHVVREIDSRVRARRERLGKV